MFHLFLALLTTMNLAEAKKVTVPINIGAGPAIYQFNGELGANQPNHYGVHLDLSAVIDKKTIADNQRQIPKKYRKMVEKLGEVRISHLLIPDALFISPKLNDTAIYGATLRPIGLDQPIGNKHVRLKGGIGLLLTYAYISEPQRTTHFIRPGLDLRAKLDIRLHERLIVSGGWSSGFYVPQTLGGSGIAGDNIWHIGQGFLMLNYRHPFKTRI